MPKDFNFFYLNRSYIFLREKETQWGDSNNRVIIFLCGYGREIVDIGCKCHDAMKDEFQKLKQKI